MFFSGDMMTQARSNTPLKVGGKKTPKNAAGTAAKPPRRAKNKSDLVKKAIKSFEKKLDSEEVKATVGDFIRLLQLQREMDGDEPREIKVTWVEPVESEPSSEE